MSNNSQNRVRVGVVGVGIGALHIEGYKMSPNAEVVAVADINVERAKNCAERFEIPRVYADYQEMLAQCDLDAVSVCTPNSFHAPVAVAAFQAGCHVLCEKPISVSAAEGQKMVDAGKASGKIFMMGFNNRFRGDTQVLKGMIDRGELGEIYYAKTGWLRRRGIPGFGGWFTTKSLSGGGPMIDLGVHVLDLALYLMGNPKPVAALGSSYAKFGPNQPGKQDFAPAAAAGTYDVEDLAAGLVKFANGATVFVEASWASNVESERIYTSLMGTKGGADLGPLRVYTEKDGVQVDMTPHCPNVNGHNAEVLHFVDCIVNGTQPIATGEHGLDVIKILDAIYQSADSGEMVQIS